MNCGQSELTWGYDPRIKERALALIDADAQRRREVAAMLRNQRRLLRAKLCGSFREYQKQMRQFLALPHKPSSKLYFRMSTVTMSRLRGTDKQIIGQMRLAEVYLSACNIMAMKEWKRGSLPTT